jgi:predicted nuclease of predicted toxin-antitoxin system
MRGHECVHLIELGLEFATDLDLWNRSLVEQRIVISKDEDFIFLANRPDDTGRLIWVRLGNCRNPAILEAFDRAHDGIVAAMDAGQRIIEIR